MKIVEDILAFVAGVIAIPVAIVVAFFEALAVATAG